MPRVSTSNHDHHDGNERAANFIYARVTVTVNYGQLGLTFSTTTEGICQNINLALPGSTSLRL